MFAMISTKPLRPEVPQVSDAPVPVRHSEQPRSYESWEKRERTLMGRLAGQFSKGAQIIKLPFSLESLINASVSKDLLEQECKRLEGVESQVMSAIFVDVNDKPILAYCAHRPLDKSKSPCKVMFRSLIPLLAFIIFSPYISVGHKHPV